MAEGRFGPQALSLLRIVAALLFLMHGTGKLFGFPAIGMNPPVLSMFWIAGVIEIFGSLLLIAGLFSRPAAFLLSGEMAYAYWTVHAPDSTFPLLNHGESAILFCFIFLAVAAAGPGPWSLDAKRNRTVVRTEDATGEPLPEG
ncbi:DoxX family protein [Sphingomonas sp. RB56-2]|uniref:DoxX family protein n=1 Tax=Sphingomonas brevis TaxID=2908206 RepID=A0ABT0S7Z8_9SPHN|nr:DoxX family protein [Sphingomonas brevis]MCL6740270.1 DoxX family protein [Sphingomonas brevis]